MERERERVGEGEAAEDPTRSLHLLAASDIFRNNDVIRPLTKPMLQTKPLLQKRLQCPESTLFFFPSGWLAGWLEDCVCVCGVRLDMVTLFEQHTSLVTAPIV